MSKDEMIKQYRKKPVVIEAIKFDGNNFPMICHFVDFKTTVGLKGGKVLIKTLEGIMMADEGDYIIKGVRGEFYPCKPDIFKATYEEVAV